MDFFFKLNVCRVCLIPETVESLNELNGDSIAMLQEIAGFTIAEAKICDKCSVHLKTCYELIRDVRGYEEHVFEPMRIEYLIISNNADDRDPEIDVDFEACRVCLMPTSEGSLESALSKYGKLLKMLNSITGIDLTKERKIHSVLICSPCSKTLQRAVQMKFIIKQNNTHYFEKTKSSLQCRNCAKTFANIFNLRRHVTSSKCGAKVSSTPDQASTGNSDKQANVCLKRRIGSNYQASESAGVNNLVCWCKKSFYKKDVLKLHKLTCTSYN